MLEISLFAKEIIAVFLLLFVIAVLGYSAVKELPGEKKI